MPLSDLTYKIAAKSVVKDFNYDEIVDWSVDMLTRGYESPSLLILSSFSKPVNQFEVNDYLKKSFEELNLSFIQGEDAKISYAKYLIIKISEKSCVENNLNTLCGFFDYQNETLNMKEFNFLKWAWGDLSYGNKYQDYWPEATLDTIEHIVVEKANKWVQNNIKN